MGFTPEAASPEYVQDISKVMNLTDEQRLLLCDLGFYNDVIRGYLILAMRGFGFYSTDINGALNSLTDVFDDVSAFAARAVYRNYPD